MLYIGPETFMPIASVLVTIASVAMLFWRRVTGMVRSGYGALATAVRRRRAR